MNRLEFSFHIEHKKTCCKHTVLAAAPRCYTSRVSRAVSNATFKAYVSFYGRITSGYSRTGLLPSSFWLPVGVWTESRIFTGSL